MSTSGCRCRTRSSATATLRRSWRCTSDRLRRRARSAIYFGARVLRAARLVLRSERVPKPVKWLAMFALLPIPGPVDEVALVLVAVLLVIFCREPLREAWRASGPN